MNLGGKTLFPFLLVLAFGIFVLVQMGMFVAHQIWNVQWTNNVFQYCLAVFQKTSAVHRILKIAFDLLIGYTFARILWRILKQIHLARRWEHLIASKLDEEQTRSVNAKFARGNGRILVIRDDAFVALTTGLLRPRIIISTGTLHLFSEKEIEAILLHEWYHCRSYDPLKTYLFVLLTDGLGYLPIIRTVARHYHTWKELLADRYAMKQMGSEYELGSVLLRLSKVRKQPDIPVAVHFSNETIDYRIMQVLEPNRPIEVPFLFAKPAIGSLLTVLIILSFLTGGCS